uniref:Uncharacterized protein n=1 Tax=Rhizophora mucronata TaxID=61149 RepID=A0A2P2Q075_RHIMU
MLAYHHEFCVAIAVINAFREVCLLPNLLYS